MSALLNEVQVIAPVGTEFGLIESKPGLLVITSRRAGEEWPHGLTPKSGLNKIMEGYTKYSVEFDDPPRHPETIYKP